MARKKKPDFVVYKNDTEVLVTTPKNEHELIEIWSDQISRPIEEYDRTEIYDTYVCGRAKLRVW